MQGQNGDFRGGNCEEVTAVVKEKTKIKAFRFGSNTLNTVCEECFDSSVVSSPPYLRCEVVASKLPRGPACSLISINALTSSQRRLSEVTVAPRHVPFGDRCAAHTLTSPYNTGPRVSATRLSLS
jgi:hypothetical protein